MPPTIKGRKNSQYTNERPQKPLSWNISLGEKENPVRKYAIHISRNGMEKNTNEETINFFITVYLVFDYKMKKRSIFFNAPL